MRRLAALGVWLWLGAPGHAGEPVRPPAAAQADYEKAERLVAAGVLPAKALEEARARLEDARDEAILQGTLYGKLELEELTEEQSREMTEAAGRRVARREAAVEAAKRLVEAGARPLGWLTAPLAELDASRKERELALARANLFRELVEFARVEIALEERMAEDPREALPLAERFAGSGYFSPSQLRVMEAAWEQEFARPMPISAKGDTALHRSLGFDHRGRVDVAVSPDSREGVWLRRLLEAQGIPYLAFRARIPGQSTAPHIHIGPPSSRLRRAD